MLLTRLLGNLKLISSELPNTSKIFAFLENKNHALSFDGKELKGLNRSLSENNFKIPELTPGVEKNMVTKFNLGANKLCVNTENKIVKCSAGSKEMIILLEFLTENIKVRLKDINGNCFTKVGEESQFNKLNVKLLPCENGNKDQTYILVDRNPSSQPKVHLAAKI
ncbi:hypothetical protein A0H76_416 [Hepatospora eriocheir]|uniref:Uncharacterized protein n=1 Tax=Hepatospora eriocheir TaxID=1081669 RepID=A0A1X0QIR9_9MICR|nr:hypothetical protein A0H76_416 [Hepatospora eriocheir]